MFCAQDTFTLEPPIRYLTAHIMGAEKGYPLLRKCMKYYENRHFGYFDDEDTPPLFNFQYTIASSPVVLGEMATAFNGYEKIRFFDLEQECKDGLHVYPSYYFNSPKYHQNRSTLYSIHRGLSGWKEDNPYKMASTEELLNRKGSFRHRVLVFFNRITVKTFGIGIGFKVYKANPYER